jgi:hypothetical protein
VSHLDDIEPLLWSPIGGGLGAIILIVALTWAFCADSASMKKCEEHGEKYIDSRADYTLCEDEQHNVVKR